MYNSTTLAWQGVVNRTFKLSILATAFASMGVFTACGTAPQNKKPTTTTLASAEQAPLLDADGLDGLEDLLYATDMRAVENDRLQILRHGDVWKRMSVGFGMDLNHFDPRIEAQRGWFISRQPYIDRLSARASRYIHYTVKEAERRGIPTELAILPIIESSYDPAATSSAAAAGLWQFIPSTGKIYGLRQSDLYDGRRDVVESTRAAYEYLSSLYNQFGSWELALASYNAGPGRIQQAINRNKAAGLPTDYWSLKLPTETMNYVPRFLAVAQIIKNPQAYGVSLPPIANRPHFREVTIPGAIDLNELSRLTGVSRGELYALNPGHRGNYTDPLAPRRILIPNDVHASVDAKIAKMNVVSGSGGLWAVETAPLPTLPTANSSSQAISTQVTTRPSSSLVTNQPSTLPTSSAIISGQPSAVVAVKPPSSNTSHSSVMVPAVNQKTPTGSKALADFAANAIVPSAPRLPVSVTPSTTTPQVKAVVEPPISETEKTALTALLEKEEQAEKTTAALSTQQIAESQATEQQKQEVIQELQQITPKGTEIVDPLDGAIKLTALQSSQSVAEQKGEELKLGYAYPRAVAEAEKDSVDAARNQGKPIIQTPKEVVVVPPQGKRDVYTVQSGDTLAIIANRFGVNWRDIANWNQINAGSPLYVGTRLYLYNAKPVVAEASAKPTRYVVKAGDNLTALAQQYRVNLSDLAAWNNLTPTSNVLIGQNLTFVEPKNFKAQQNNIDTQPKQGTEDQKTSTDLKIATESYTVKRGEFLKLIADRYGLSVAELAALTPNLSTSANLLVGQKIRVPKDMPKEQVVKPVETKVPVEAANESKKPDFATMTYTVAAGDYLSTVAQKHKMSLVEIAQLNNLKVNSSIMVGQKLTVKQIAPPRPSSYKVQSGDTLTGVAQKFELSTQQLANINGLSSNAMLRAGTVLKLEGDEKNELSGNVDVSTANAKRTEEDKPAAESFKGDTESYKVRSGENLTVIAQRYKVSVATLAGLNKLTPRSNLQVGQQLKVPKLTTDYTVKRGDTLIGLAQRFGISTEALAQMNSIKADTQVRLGQVLTVPN